MGRSFKNAIGALLLSTLVPTTSHSADTWTTPTIQVTAEVTLENSWECKSCNWKDGNSHAWRPDIIWKRPPLVSVPGLPRPENLPQRSSSKRPISKRAASRQEFVISNVQYPSLKTLNNVANSSSIPIPPDVVARLSAMSQVFSKKSNMIGIYFDTYYNKERVGSNSLPYPLGQRRPQRYTNSYLGTIYAANVRGDVTRADHVQTFRGINAGALFRYPETTAVSAAYKIFGVRNGEFQNPLTPGEAALAFAYFHPEFAQASSIELYTPQEIPNLFYRLRYTPFAKIPGMSSVMDVALAGMATTPFFYVTDAVFDKIYAKFQKDASPHSVYAITVPINAGAKNGNFYPTHAVVVKNRYKGDASVLLHEATHAGFRLLEQRMIQRIMAAKAINGKWPTAPMGHPASYHLGLAEEYDAIGDALDQLTPKMFMRELKMVPGESYFASGEEFTTHLYAGVIPDFLNAVGAIDMTSAQANSFSDMTKNFILGLSRETAIPFDQLPAEREAFFALTADWVYTDKETQSVLRYAAAAVKKELTLKYMPADPPKDVTNGRGKFKDHLVKRIIRSILLKVYRDEDET